MAQWGGVGFIGSIVDYSLRKLTTALALAARRVWTLTVNNEIDNTARPASTNTILVIGIR